MKTFEEEKKECLDKLYKPDKSKKGDVDEFLIPLINLINTSKQFFTTSSCSGRISIFTIDDKNKKNSADWIFVSHEKIKFEDVINSIKQLPETLVRFKFEPLILHVCCKSLEDAQELISFCQEIGLKDSGIMSSKNKIIVKINGSERIDAPIAINGKLIVDEDYLNFVTNLANKKLEKTHEKIKIIEKNFSSNFNK